MISIIPSFIHLGYPEGAGPNAGHTDDTALLVHHSHLAPDLICSWARTVAARAAAPLAWDDALFQGLGAMPQTAEEHPGIGKIQRPQFNMGLQEKAVGIQRQF